MFNIIFIFLLLYFFYTNLQLKKENNKKETLFQKTPIAYVIGDLKERTIISANKYAYNLFEYPENKKLDISTKQFHITEQDYLNFEKIINNYIKKKGSLEGFNITWKFKTYKSKKILYINILATMYSNKEVLWILNDITNISKTKETLQNELHNNKILLKEKDEFLSNISHELKTPLNSIIGFTTILLETKEYNQDYLNFIFKSANNLHQLINDILNINKLNNNNIIITKSFFDIQLYIKNIIENFKPLLNEKNLKLNIDYNFENQKNIYTDKILLKEILHHLIDNAIKFSPINTDINIKIKTLKENFYFEIKNKGEKINPLIFTKFKQKDSSLKRKYEGLGIGLTITMNFLKLLKGTLKYKNKNNKNIFYFSIPIKYFKDIEHILIVEDNKANQLFLKTILNTLGYKCINIVENGKECIKFLKNNKTDIIFMDINMPIMDGITAAKIIKRKCKEYIPIVATTANTINKDKYLKYFDFFLPKPVLKKDLQNILKI